MQLLIQPGLRIILIPARLLAVIDAHEIQNYLTTTGGALEMEIKHVIVQLFWTLQMLSDQTDQILSVERVISP